MSSLTLGCSGSYSGELPRTPTSPRPFTLSPIRSLTPTVNPDPNALNPNPNPNPSPSPNPKPGPDPKPEPEPHPTQGELPRHPEPFRADELKDMLETSMNKHDPISNNYNEVSTRARARARSRAHARARTRRGTRTDAHARQRAMRAVHAAR